MFLNQSHSQGASRSPGGKLEFAPRYRTVNDPVLAVSWCQSRQSGDPVPVYPAHYCSIFPVPAA